jgi:deoxycytidine triphosphate deaminase
MKKISITDEKPFVLHPGEFALGLILEETGVSNQFVGRLEGKSSVGRLGLLIHVTAGFLDPGNSLKMTLELHNTANMPILLYYKMPIAQTTVFFKRKLEGGLLCLGGLKSSQPHVVGSTCTHDVLVLLPKRAHT